MKNTELKLQMIDYINKTTHKEKLEEKSTKQIAEHFGIDTKTAYNLLISISDQKKGTRQITHLDLVNGQHFDCCGWIRNQDPE